MQTTEVIQYKHTRPLTKLEYTPCDPYKSKMDMKQQLVLWKRTGYLLDHLSLTQDFLNRLVDVNLFNRPMMDEIQSKGYQVERILVMLSLLGQHGDDVYETFIRVLEEFKHFGVVHELRKTEKYLYYGEMLPPVFTYFLDLSEFLRLYPHIALKLSEDEKHILQSFIDGKIDMSTRKIAETNHLLELQIIKLKQNIAELKRRIRAHEARELELEEELRRCRERILSMEGRISELEQALYDWKCEVRRLKHFRHEQEELDGYLKEQGEEKRIGLSPMEMIHRLPTFIKSKKATNTSSVKLKLLSAQVHMQLNKLYYVQDHMQSLGYLEKRLNSFVGKPTETFDKETIQDLHNLKTLLNDTKEEKQAMMHELTEEERAILAKEQEIQKLRVEILGKSATPDYQTEGHTSLRSKMLRLLDWIQQVHEEKVEAINARHAKEIVDLMNHIKEINLAHQKDKEVLKWRHRVKMGELHRREMLHRRMKHQILVLSRYHAKNMNATVSVEQCRKIVRDIIGDARKLRKMVDEAELLEKNPGGTGPQTEEEEAKEREEREKQEKAEATRKEQADTGAYKKKKRRKDVDYLKNERLMYVADRLFGEWRVLGINIGLSMNRMDMIEHEVPPGATPDTIGYAMLKAWRDEVKGKVSIKAGRLVKGLLKMGRKDLAIIVLPLHRVDLLMAESEEEERKAEQKAREVAEEERLLAAARKRAEAASGGESEPEGGETSDAPVDESMVVLDEILDTGSATNRLAAVPVLPEINAPA